MISNTSVLDMSIPMKEKISTKFMETLLLKRMKIRRSMTPTLRTYCSLSNIFHYDLLNFKRSRFVVFNDDNEAELE